jgi:hypothetical protein
MPPSPGICGHRHSPQQDRSRETHYEWPVRAPLSVRGGRPSGGDCLEVSRAQVGIARQERLESLHHASGVRACPVGQPQVTLSERLADVMIGPPATCLAQSSSTCASVSFIALSATTRLTTLLTGPSL